QGAQEFDPGATVGDFVLRRADRIFAYQLAVVIDDAAMGVTQVLRGEDLLPSTARQILLYRLLGLREPRWAHAGLVASASGERLSKRDRAASLSALRAAGRDPGELVTRLCAVAGRPGLPGRGLDDRVPADNTTPLLAYAAGKMRKSPIRILPGDRVKLEPSPYDLTRGRITYRQK